ncbi:MAG TPA: rhodanese-like domain-containing protein [Thermoanaerobaculia bacterium]|nr:rhodanese-like domain-containing protein [Thermoanaerobaculia bacterium]
MPRGSNIARVIALIALGAGAAVLSNLAASTQRKLAWTGSYPRALDVGAPTVEAAPTASIPAAAEPTAPPAVSAGSPPPVQVTAPPAPPAALEPDLAKSFPPHPDKSAIEVAPENVLLLHRRNALFLDARRSSVYADGHIPGARSLPVWESDIDARVKALYEEGLDQRAPIVAYCSGGNCEDSHMLAEKLYMVGFDNVLIYKDGFPDWQKRGLPVNRGANP